MNLGSNEYIPEQNKLTLAFKDLDLEREFKSSYDKSVRGPLRFGIIISLISWFSAIGLIYAIIPEDLLRLGSLTIVVIGSYFGFIIYATYHERFKGYYHLLGAISNAWAGLYAIYFCHQFPNGAILILPVLIFIIFFGSYMVRLRWIAGFIAALIYTVTFQIYILEIAELSAVQVSFYAFINWMVLIFAIFAGRVAEENNRINFVQRRTIRAQSLIIEREKEVLLKEVHHRVHNNLQVIVSLMNLKIAKLNDPEIAKDLAEMQRRILSMALVHQRINQSSNFIEISVKEYVDRLIENIKGEFPDVALDHQVVIDTNVQVDIETAIPLGMIMNEMISGFLKNASEEKRSNNEFHLAISKHVDGKFVLNYRDNSSEFDNLGPDELSDHFSLELMDALACQLDGEFKFHPDKGAVYEIRF